MRVYVNEKPDNPQEGDIWLRENQFMYQYTEKQWITFVDLEENSQLNAAYVDYQGDLQKTSETHAIIPLLCLGILVSLITLMLLLMIL